MEICLNSNCRLPLEEHTISKPHCLLGKIKEDYLVYIGCQSYWGIVPLNTPHYIVNEKLRKERKHGQDI